jgi:hypothetical protein
MTDWVASKVHGVPSIILLHIPAAFSSLNSGREKVLFEKKSDCFLKFTVPSYIITFNPLKHKDHLNSI